MTKPINQNIIQNTEISVTLRKMIQSLDGVSCVEQLKKLHQGHPAVDTNQWVDALCCMRRGQLTIPWDLIVREDKASLSTVGLERWIQVQGFQSFSALDVCVLKNDPKPLEYLLEHVGVQRWIEDPTKKLDNNVKIAVFYNMGLAIALASHRCLDVYAKKGLLLHWHDKVFMNKCYDAALGSWYQLYAGVPDWILDPKLALSLTQKKYIQKPNGFVLWLQEYMGEQTDKRFAESFLVQAVKGVPQTLAYGGVKSDLDFKSFAASTCGPWDWSVLGCHQALVSLSAASQGKHWGALVQHLQEDQTVGILAIQWVAQVWVNYVSQSLRISGKQRMDALLSEGNVPVQEVFETLLNNTLIKERDETLWEQLQILKEQQALCGATPKAIVRAPAKIKTL